jgi:ubiquinone/menaquinone biosynthesis C-methylase UbiE
VSLPNALARLRGTVTSLANVVIGKGPVKPSRSSQEYWSQYNVTANRVFTTAEESLRYLRWRSSQYYDYETMMPVSGADGRIVLDYGCGPGHDLVGFATASSPARLLGVDVSQASLAQACHRLALHGKQAELIKIDENVPALPLPDRSVDCIHCSGVLHHLPDAARVLREFRRIIRPDGILRLMVYNYESLWLHLFAAYLMRFKQPNGRQLTVREAFRRSTDTAECPISHAWTALEVAGMAAQAGFACAHLGNATSVREIAILPERFAAILDPELEDEHRTFLLGLTFDARALPYRGSNAAGIDGCYRLAPQ